MADTMEIINVLSQIATSQGHDGAVDEKGEPVKIGLKREEGHPILDSRIMDGFGVRFYGDKLCVKYHAECMLKDVHDPKFESNVEGMINDVVKFLRKEYKSQTGKGIGLNAIADMPVTVVVQNLSRVRSMVQAEKHYKIGGIEALPYDENEEPKLDDAVRKWLELGKKNPKPENVTTNLDKNKAPTPYKKEKLD